jgi:two-component system NarL family sensor kinase
MTTRTTTKTLTPSRAVVRRQSSDLQKLVVEHAIRGAALHVQLRALLVTFVLGTVLWVPPEHYAGICLALSVSYVVFAAAVAWWFRVRPATLVQLTWLVLTIDLLMFGAVNELAGVSDRMSWTPYILVNGFVLVPILAAAQLRLRIVTTTGIAATAL